MATLISPGVSVTVIDEDVRLSMNEYYVVCQVPSHNEEIWYKVWANNAAFEWICSNDADQWFRYGPVGTADISESLLIMLKLKFPTSDISDNIITFDIKISPIRSIYYVNTPIKVTKNELPG